MSWSPWTNEEVSTISDQLYRVCSYSHRLRIAHLRRMVCSIHGAIERTQWFPAYTEQEFERKKWRRRDRFTRFAKACNAEIARLRGEG